MDETAQQIQQEAQSGSNDTPAIADSGGGGDGGGGGGMTSSLPVPSVDKKTAAVGLGVIVALAVAWYVWSRSGPSGTSAAAAKEQLKGGRTSTVEDEDGDDSIEVPQDPQNPLSADNAVVEQFRDRGILTTPEDG